MRVPRHRNIRNREGRQAPQRRGVHIVKQHNIIARGVVPIVRINQARIARRNGILPRRFVPDNAVDHVIFITIIEHHARRITDQR